MKGKNQLSRTKFQGRDGFAIWFLVLGFWFLLLRSWGGPLLAVTVRVLRGCYITENFLETLASLSEVGLTPDRAKEVFRERLRRGIRGYVACLDGRVVGSASLLVEEKFIHGGGLS